MVRERIPFHHRAKVLGLVSSGTSYGVFVNGLIALLLITRYHWRFVWLTVGAITLLIFLSALLYVASADLFSPLAHCREDAPEQEKNKPETGQSALFSGSHMIIWLMLFFCGLSCMPFQTYLVPFIRDELLFPMETAGRIWSIIGFTGMGGGFAMGVLSDRIGIRFSLAITSLLLATAAILICWHAGPFWLMAAGICFGLAFYAMFGLMPAYISKTADPGRATLIFGIGNVALGLGSIAGDLTGGWLKTTTGTFVWSYVTIALTAGILVMLSLLLPDETPCVIPDSQSQTES